MTFDTPFNLPFIVGKELHYIAQAVTLGSLGGDGPFTRKCCQLLEERFEIPKVLLTPSCTAALEMAAMLCNLKEGDEVIMPSFTFVSTANAVVRAGGRPVFVDIRPDTLNLNEQLIARSIGPKTRAIFAVHYAGIGCEMEPLMELAEQSGLVVVEDAAQGVNGFYRGRALGSIGHLGTYSFHETKNFISGEGGALCVNDLSFLERAHILRDKGTNRQSFLRGEVDRYRWVDVGSSYVPSELIGAFLFGQLEEMEQISKERRDVFFYYLEQLQELEEQGFLRRPVIPSHCQHNNHLFYILLPNAHIREALIRHLKESGIQAITHFEPLHSSPLARRLGYGAESLPVTESVASRLLRLPLFYGITREQQSSIVNSVYDFFSKSGFSRAARSASMQAAVKNRTYDKSTHSG